MKKDIFLLTGAFLLVACGTTPNGNHCLNKVFDPASMVMTICGAGTICNDSSGRCEVPSASTTPPVLIGDPDVKFTVPGFTHLSKVEVLGVSVPFNTIAATADMPSQISIKSADLGELKVCGPIDVVLVKLDGDRVVLRDATANKFSAWQYKEAYTDIAASSQAYLKFGFSNYSTPEGNYPYMTYLTKEGLFGFTAMRGLINNSTDFQVLSQKTAANVQAPLTDYLIGNFTPPQASIRTADIIFISPPTLPPSKGAYAGRKSVFPQISFLNETLSPVDLPTGKNLLDYGVVKVSDGTDIPVALMIGSVTPKTYLETYQGLIFKGSSFFYPNPPLSHLSVPSEVQNIQQNGNILSGGISPNAVYSLRYPLAGSMISPMVAAVEPGKSAISIASTINAGAIKHYVLMETALGREVSCYEELSAETLGISSSIQVDKGAESIELRDVNCDGRPDVIVKSPSRIFAYLVNSRNQLEAEPKLLYEGPEFRKSAMWNSQDRAPYQILGVQSTDGTLQLFKQQ